MIDLNVIASVLAAIASLAGGAVAVAMVLALRGKRDEMYRAHREDYLQTKERVEKRLRESRKNGL